MSTERATRLPNARLRALGLERSLPYTRLPDAIARQPRRDETVDVGDLPLDEFTPRHVEEVLRPAVATLIESAVAEIESPPRADPAALARNVRAAVEDAVAQFAWVVWSGQPTIDRTLFRRLGHKHARAGLPMADLTSLFTRGALACWRGVLELHADGQVPDELLDPASDVVFALAQELSTAAVEGYEEAVSSAGATVRSDRADLLRMLVSGEDLDPYEARRRAWMAGWDLPDDVAAAVTSPSQRLAQRPPWTDEVLSAPYGTQWCLLLPVLDSRVREPDLIDGVTLAVGPVVPWAQARRSLEIAEDLLSLTSEGLVARDGIVRTSDHGVELVLAREPAVAEELVRGYLGPILAQPEHRRETLLETLLSWVRRPGQHTVLAEELHISVRTVRYRVDRIRQLIGDVVDDPARRLELALAVRALTYLDEIQLERATEGGPSGS